ncbi:MAG: hypothetical protein ACXV7D_04770 [Thermoanaerobaculia bacterium]
MIIRASALLALLGMSCRAIAPWIHSREGRPNEVNIAFTLQNNLLFLQGTSINQKTGRFFYASATPKAIIDRGLVDQFGGPKGPFRLTVSPMKSFVFTPLFLELGQTGDAMIGWEVFQPNAITIDYRSGLITLQEDGIYTSMMTVYRFTGAPAVDVDVDGRRMTAIIDTALPDTMAIPGPTIGRETAHVAIAGTDMGDVDVHIGGVDQARIGNRLLSKFLISIDYRAGQVGLWRDPRIR